MALPRWTVSRCLLEDVVRDSRTGIAVCAVALLVSLELHAAEKEYVVKGMVLSVDASAKTFVVSHERIVGLMEAMTMPFEVRQAGDLRDVVPGAIVEFTLVVGDTTSYARSVVVRRYQTIERDPSTARRLATMKRMAGLATPPLSIGAAVPDFALIDQQRQRVTLAGLSGKVVAVNFVYTRCALPQFCLRMSNNFAALQKRFARELGGELVLLTITFDPERDTPEALASYASRWQANLAGWHFLTGSSADIRRVCGFFGQEAFADEGLMNHSLHTVVIGRTGTLVANIEGNQFTPEQLGDLVAATLRR
ncbi:MAG TPA: SCO family protein, partial [Vicinamibacterales bacterium]|nr:SCO family protein [Vicinamibacterales bacterium]